MGLFSRQHDCRVHGHRFEPRYDSQPPASLKARFIDSDDIKALHSKIYVYDICVRCGAVVRRDGGDNGRNGSGNGSQG